MTVRVDNRINSFSSNAKNLLNDALRESAVNILVASKSKAPFDKGGLRSDTEAKQIQKLKWRISYWKEYARFQEFGGDGNRIVRNYKTPGTGKRYLSTAGNNEVSNLIQRLRVYGRRART